MSRAFLPAYSHRVTKSCLSVVRLPAVICWFTFLFALIATFVSWFAARRVRNNPYPAYANNSEEISEKKAPAQVSQTAA